VSDQPSPQAESLVAAALTAALAARYPGRFSPDELTRLEVLIKQLDEAAQRLRRYPLTNGDEPDPIFRAAWAEG
jgi:hypothetical protein